MDTSKSAASKTAAEKGARFIVMWHNPHAEYNQLCSYRTKKAAEKMLTKLVEYHPDWNIVMGAV